jgi:hypothetical protein
MTTRIVPELETGWRGIVQDIAVTLGLAKDPAEASKDEPEAEL